MTDPKDDEPTERAADVDDAPDDETAEPTDTPVPEDDASTSPAPAEIGGLGTLGG